MEQVRAAVLESTGVELVPEVRMLGFDEDFPSARGADEASGDECARGAAGGTSACTGASVASTAGSAPSTGERGTPSADAAAGETAGEAGALSAGEGRRRGRSPWLGDRATATSRFPGAPPRGGVRAEAFRAAPRRRGAPRRPRCARLRPDLPRPCARPRAHISARRHLRRPAALPAVAPRARAPRPAR